MSTAGHQHGTQFSCCVTRMFFEDFSKIALGEVEPRFNMEISKVSLLQLEPFDCEPTKLGGSKNRGFYPPQIIHFNRVSIINHPFWGTPIFGNIHYTVDLCSCRVVAIRISVGFSRFLRGICGVVSSCCCFFTSCCRSFSFVCVVFYMVLGQSSETKTWRNNQAV